MSSAPGRKHNIFHCAQWTFKFFFFLSYKFSSLWLWRSLVTWLLPFFFTAWAGLRTNALFHPDWGIWLHSNGSRSQMLWWFSKEIFERNSILGHWYFVSLWSCIVILQGSTLRRKIFWCEKSKLFIPKMLKLDVSVFLTFSPPVFLLKHSYDFTKHPMFDKFWYSGSSFSKSL